MSHFEILTTFLGIFFQISIVSKLGHIFIYNLFIHSIHAKSPNKNQIKFIILFIISKQILMNLYRKSTTPSMLFISSNKH